MRWIAICLALVATVGCSQKSDEQWDKAMFKAESDGLAAEKSKLSQAVAEDLDAAHSVCTKGPSESCNALKARARLTIIAECANLVHRHLLIESSPQKFSAPISPFNVAKVCNGMP